MPFLGVLACLEDEKTEKNPDHFGLFVYLHTSYRSLTEGK